MTGELAELAPILCAKYPHRPLSGHDLRGGHAERVVPVLLRSYSLKAKGAWRRWASRSCSAAAPPRSARNGWSTRIPRASSSDSRSTRSSGRRGSRARTSTRPRCLWTEGARACTTDEFLRSEKYPNVFVAGDNLFYTPVPDGAPVPQMVENAEHSADTIAHNLAAEITGDGEPEAYKPKFHG